MKFYKWRNKGEDTVLLKFLIKNEWSPFYNKIFIFFVGFTNKILHIYG